MKLPAVPRPRRGAVVLALAVASLLVVAAPASGGAPPAVPVVQITGTGTQSPSAIGECDGSVTQRDGSAVISLARTPVSADELTVFLTFTVSGDVGVDVADLPTSVTFAADAERADIAFPLVGPGPGAIDMAVDADPAYTLGVLTTSNLGISTLPPAWDCHAPLPVDDALVGQTIGVGGVPQPYGFFPRAADPAPTGRDGTVTPEDYYTVVRGTLPPGLTYVDDVWGGAATTPGTYGFAVSLCTGPGGWLPDRELCMGTLDAEVVVRAAGAGPGPGPGARPAVPVTGVARLTG